MIPEVYFLNIHYPTIMKRTGRCDCIMETIHILTKGWSQTRCSYKKHFWESFQQGFDTSYDCCCSFLMQ